MIHQEDSAALNDLTALIIESSSTGPTSWPQHSPRPCIKQCGSNGGMSFKPSLIREPRVVNATPTD